MTIRFKSVNEVANVDCGGRKTVAGQPRDAAAVYALVRLINQAQEEQKRDILEFVEEKFERRLSEEISHLEVRLSAKMADLDVKMNAVKSDF